MLRLLIDEDVHGDILHGLRRRQPALDLVRVQDVGLSHTPDPMILEWAAKQQRMVVSVDKKTLAVSAWDRVARGLPMPGVAIGRGPWHGLQTVSCRPRLAHAGGCYPAPPLEHWQGHR